MKLVTGKFKDQFVIIETTDELASKREGLITSEPRKHTLWYEDGQPMIVVLEAKDSHPATPQEIEKYERLKERYEQSSIVNVIWDAGGLMLGNYVRRSQDNYWAPQFKGTICQITIDEMILIDTQAPRGIFEYIDLDDEWLDQFEFFVDKSKAHFKYNMLGNIFQLNKVGANYEFTWGAVRIRHVHTLQNLASILTRHELTRKDGKR